MRFQIINGTAKNGSNSLFGVIGNERLAYCSVTLAKPLLIKIIWDSFKPLEQRIVAFEAYNFLFCEGSDNYFELVAR